MIDLRERYNKRGSWPKSKKTGKYVLHYNGPSTKKFRTDIAVFDNDYAWHIGEPPNGQGWVGIAYHYGVGRDGNIYQLNDEVERLNHAGVPWANDEAIAVQLTVGEGDLVSDRQLNALAQFLEQKKVKPRFLSTHREAPRTTACPGAIIQRWVDNYRTVNSGARFEGVTKFTGNVRDEANVLSHLVRQVGAGIRVKGVQILGKPVRGDSLWIQLDGTTDFIHASLFGV